MIGKYNYLILAIDSDGNKEFIYPKYEDLNEIKRDKISIVVKGEEFLAVESQRKMDFIKQKKGYLSDSIDVDLYIEKLLLSKYKKFIICVVHDIKVNFIESQYKDEENGK